MHFLFTIPVYVCLAIIVYQDCAARSVQWIYFPALALAGIISAYSEPGMPWHWLFQPMINLLFLSLQFGLLKIYYMIRHGRQHILINKKIGLGDLLFLAAAGFLFSPVNFAIFYLCSLLFSQVIWLLTGLIKLTSDPSVPLAGLQAIFLLITLSAGLCFNFSLHSGSLINLNLIFP
jgi:hypothetical protein